MSLRTLIVALFGLCVYVDAQTFPVGLKGREDYERRKYLMGEPLNTSSLMIRPITSIGNEHQSIMLRSMPLVWQQQYNSNQPEGINNAAMIPARGYQTMVSAGVFFKYKYLSMQLMPEFVYAQNKEFDRLSPDLPEQLWKVYNGIKQSIDLPDKFGDMPYHKLYWGQSSLRFNFRSFSLGVSNENLWWGPGIKNTLLMTNNAPGFKHITFNTIKPISTPIGRLEGQIIGGKLESSGFPGVDSLSLAQKGIRFYMRNQGWRYINAMIINYQPKWFPGLHIGGVRSFTLPSNIMSSNYRTYLPLLEPMFKLSVGGEVADTIPSDQIASIYARWVMPESKSEVYFEYGREDHSWDLTDFILEPGHYRAYILGIRRLVSFFYRKDEFIDFHFELTQLGRNYTSSLRKVNTPAIWYLYDGHGYTHQGQIIGSAVGPSSNMQTLSISWVKDYKRIGIELQRFAHDEDFWAYIVQKGIYGNSQSHWVDFSGSLLADWDLKKMTINFKCQFVGSMNYMYNNEPTLDASTVLWGNIPLRSNLHISLSLIYFM